jgi:hypothetical protein
VRLRLLLPTVAVVIAAPLPAFTHGGGLDANGCHSDRKRGGYHCHRGAPTPSPATRSPQQIRASDEPQGVMPVLPFGNCTAARLAGRTPVRRGEPGYGPHLDRDGDGVACER